MPAESSPDLGQIEGAAHVDLRSFDLKIEGRVADKDGVSLHAIDFNAYEVLKASADQHGANPSEAELIHDAQQLVEDMKSLRSGGSHRHRPGSLFLEAPTFAGRKRLRFKRAK